jgi:hypothetical protein
VRSVDYWLWGLSVGLTEDPARCARVASTGDDAGDGVTVGKRTSTRTAVAVGTLVVEPAGVANGPFDLEGIAVTLFMTMRIFDLPPAPLHIETANGLAASSHV